MPQPSIAALALAAAAFISPAARSAVVVFAGRPPTPWVAVAPGWVLARI